MNPSASPTWLRLSALTVLCTAALLQGCATPQNRDPLESFNRKMFRFNEVLDDTLLRPVATGYDAVTPEPVQRGIDNFSNNIKDVWSIVNLMLQGRPGMAVQTVLRVGVNTAFGVAGFVDVATPMQLDRPVEDLGQTLAVWGAPSGAYLMLPFFGPSTVRDAAAMPVDMQVSASKLFSEPRDVNAVRVLSIVNKRAMALNATSLLGDIALDRYSFVRDAYLQRRESQIYNGDPPGQGSDEDMDYERYDGPIDQQSAVEQGAAPVAVLWHQPVMVSEVMDRTLTVSEDFLAELTAWTAPVGSSDFANTVPTADELAGLREHADLR